MFTLQKPNRKTSARKQINIREVRDNTLILPGDQYRAIIEVSSINFELKSEAEQDSIIDIYESFLNSVGCPLQILVRIREMDMDRYLADIADRFLEENDNIYKEQLKSYDVFIRSLIANNRILTRMFYIIVPFDALAKTDFNTIKEQLDLRIDIVRKGLTRLGMQSRQLTSLEILDQFYEIYNPGLAKLQPLSSRALEIIHTEFLQKGTIND